MYCHVKKVNRLRISKNRVLKQIYGPRKKVKLV